VLAGKPIWRESPYVLAGRALPGKGPTPVARHSGQMIEMNENGRKVVYINPAHMCWLEGNFPIPHCTAQQPNVLRTAGVPKSFGAIRYARPTIVTRPPRMPRSHVCAAQGSNPALVCRPRPPGPVAAVGSSAPNASSSGAPMEVGGSLKPPTRLGSSNRKFQGQAHSVQRVCRGDGMSVQFVGEL
jgi:hypothetical protein